MNRAACSSLLSLGAFVALAAPCWSHGAQYMTPGQAGGAYPPSMGPRGGAGGAGASTGVAPGPGQVSTSSGSGAAAADSWEQWWFENEDRFLQLRAQLVLDAPASGQGPLTGIGRVERGGTRRAASAQVESEILPLLLELLEHDDETEVRDSALIALGRCADEPDAERVLAAVRPLLSSEVLSVQSSAVLALGIHGSPRFVPLLGAILADTASGRQAVGGTVPPLVRSLAALSLGLGNHAMAVPMLTSTLADLPDSQGQLKACLITALGMTANEAGSDALAALFALLRQRHLQPLLGAQVPLAIARLEGGTRIEAVPPLLEAFTDKDTDDRVRVSLAMALGRLAGFDEPPVIDALLAAAHSEHHAATRHAALMALAEIGLRDAPDEAVHAEAHKRLVTELRKLLADPATFADHAWCALAAGVYAHGGGALAATLKGPLIDEYTARKEPSLHGACVVALGLAHATEVGGVLLEDFRKPGDSLLRGHAAVALGLLGVPDATREMLATCSDKSTDPLLREQVALGLAVLRDPQVVPTLLDVLGRGQSLPASLAAARGLGRIGDRSAITALAALARDKERPQSTRSMAVVALGLLGERGDLPWNATLRELHNTEAPVDALELVLDIL